MIAQVAAPSPAAALAVENWFRQRFPEHVEEDPHVLGSVRFLEVESVLDETNLADPCEKLDFGLHVVRRAVKGSACEWGQQLKIC